MRILVTGASGFVGGTFMRRFANRPGVTLLGVSRSRSTAANYRQLDLAQPIALEFTPDVVVHCAARASPWGTDAEFRSQNVDATRHLIEWCERSGLPRLLYLSTSAVFYRHAHQYRLTESSPIGPTFVNEYAATKYAAELLVRAYAGSAVILRPRAVFGAGDTVVFPRILAAARAGRLPRFVTDGAPVMGDLIHVVSLCDYIWRAAVAPSLRDAYNLTNAEPVELQALVHDVLGQLGIALPTRRIRVSTAMRAARVTEWVYRMLRLGSEPPITRFGVSAFAYAKTFDVTRMLADFGAPTVSIAEGVREFVLWQRAEWANPRVSPAPVSPCESQRP
jgi:2-alkyl-3-oxoalkanoate reductase